MTLEKEDGYNVLFGLHAGYHLIQFKHACYRRGVGFD